MTVQVDFSGTLIKSKCCFLMVIAQSGIVEPSEVFHVIITFYASFMMVKYSSPLLRIFSVEWIFDGF